MGSRGPDKNGRSIKRFFSNDPDARSAAHLFACDQLWRESTSLECWGSL